MNLAITIATYKKSNGKSPFYLTRALDIIFNQTHQDFKVYIIGDRYEDNDEFNNIISKYPQNKIYSENLPYAKERDEYINTHPYAVWCVGGVNAINHAIDLALNDGYYYICHLDHDDFWEINHLYLINQLISDTSADWICTKSHYCGRILPVMETSERYINFIPKNGALINSSTCINLKTIPIRPRDVFRETGVEYPADADRWIRIAEYIKKYNLKSYMINSITCHHDEEFTGV